MNFVAQIANFDRSKKYDSAAGGLFMLSSIARAILPGLRGADLFSYMFRRFGPPTVGSDDFKQLAQYYITTPIEGLFLGVSPYMGLSEACNFRYCVDREIASRISSLERGPFIEWRNAAGRWYHENHLELIPQVLHETIVDSEGSPLGLWYDFSYWDGVVADDGTRFELQPVWDAAFASYPDPKPEPFDCQLKKDCLEALTVAMKDLLRPTYVRDVYFNALGHIGDQDIVTAEVQYGVTADYSTAAGYGVPMEFVKDPAGFWKSVEDTRVKLESIKGIVGNLPELNIGNYDEDQVADLNNAVIEVWRVLQPAD